uniref:Uncharacterized protein n=1 Tax=Ciona intestinalis TaxID=7719 RepID=F6XSM8_CIOIN
ISVYFIAKSALNVWFHLNVGVDEADVVRHSGVNTWVVWVGASNAPRYDTVNSTVANDWAAGITLARVFSSSSQQSKAHHTIIDPSTVCVVAVRV